ERIIGTQNLWPNRHDDYGHTFGADPWIGLIEWHKAQASTLPQRVTLGAFAYHGYFTLCSFHVPPSIHVALRELDPLTDRVVTVDEPAWDALASLEACE